MKKNYYSEKVQLCKELSSLNVKKVTDSHVISAAKKINLPFESAQRAWRIFQETGGKKVDRRGSGRSVWNKTGNTLKPLYTKQRTVKPSEAASIIIEYASSNIRIIELCNKHKLVPEQFYNWIHEIQVSGTLLGKMILNPKKYAKVEVLDVIRIMKFPNTRKNSIITLSELERAAYERVGTVLKKYLSALAEV